MPKKKRNSDFKKVKEKVGKKLKKLNETNTNFTVKSIILPNQSILVDKIGPKNQRNLRFIDLIPQLNHTNINIRKDALLGLKDLFIKNPEILLTKLNETLNSILPMFCDIEKSVRYSLYTLIEYILNNVNSFQYDPYMKITVVYICHAMTSIHSSVKKDITSILKLYISKYPNLISKYSDVIIKNISSLLKYSDDITMRTKHLKNKNKLDVDIDLINSLRLFLSEKCPNENYNSQCIKIPNIKYNDISDKGLLILNNISDHLIYEAYKVYEITETSASGDSLENAFKTIWNGLSNIWMEKIIDVNNTNPQLIIINLLVEIIQCLNYISSYFLKNDEFDKLIDINNIIKLFGKQYLSQFPLRLSEGSNKNEINKLINKHNLSLAIYLYNINYIYCRNSRNNVYNDDLYPSLIAYFNKLLKNIDFRGCDIDENGCNYLILLLIENSKHMKKNEIDEMLCLYLKCIKKCPLKSPIKKILFRFLLDILNNNILFDEEGLNYEFDISVIKESLELIIQYILQIENNTEILNELLYNIIHLIVKIKDEKYLNEFELSIKSFFTFTNETKSLFSRFDDNTKRIFSSLLYYLPKTYEFTNILTEFIKNEGKDLNKSILEQLIFSFKDKESLIKCF